MRRSRVQLAEGLQAMAVGQGKIAEHNSEVTMGQPPLSLAMQQYVVDSAVDMFLAHYEQPDAD